MGYDSRYRIGKSLVNIDRRPATMSEGIDELMRQKCMGSPGDRCRA